jgi:penicillin-binding protein 1A
VDVLRAKQQAASFGRAVWRGLVAGLLYLCRLTARGLRRLFFAIFRFSWRLLSSGVLWIVTESPLSEPRRNAHRPLPRLLAWVVIAIAWTTITLAALVSYYAAVLPDPRAAGLPKVPPNLTILARGGEFIAERGMRRDYIPYRDIPPALLKAVIATEDRRFFYHFGFDPVGLLRAMRADLKSREVIEGGSTITQQLAKNLFLEPKRTFARKCEEFVLALWLESRFSKKDILELYLNRVYFGAGNYGIGAAAHDYFGKAPRELTLAEAALLVGLIKAPSYYSPLANIGRAEKRTREILRRLAETDQIDINQYAEALANPARLKTAAASPGFGYAADWVVEAAPMLVGATDRNLTVETTIDASLQRTAVKAIEDELRTKGGGARVTEAAFVLMTPDGAVRAIVGGRSHAESQFDRAISAMRQPGSAFKPFIYLAAMESGDTPDTSVDDSPVDIDGWEPENFGKIYRGKITLRTALTHSSNAAAVRLARALGPQRILEVAHRLGVASARDVGPTLALGTSEVTLLEMTSAFAVFGNGGLAVTPGIIERIRDDKGKVLFERSKDPPARIVSLRAVAAMNDMMNSVVAGGTGREAALALHPVGGKTGTTQSFKDAWFIGYTAHYAGGVWIGNDNASPMRGVTGGSLPAEIWKTVMLKAHEGLETQPLPGTELDAEFAKRALEASGLADLPQPNPFRSRETRPETALPPGSKEVGEIAHAAVLTASQPSPGAKGLGKGQEQSGIGK